MSDKTAKEDIVVVNDAGQRVVLVPAGQPIPANLDVLKARTAGKAAEPVEDKAVSKPKRSRK